MKQKYLREFIPLFEAEDNEELVEGLIVMGLKSFLNAHGTIKRGSGKLLRESVETICLEFEKGKSTTESTYRELSKQIENVSRKLDSSKSEINSEISSIRAERQTGLAAPGGYQGAGPSSYSSHSGATDSSPNKQRSTKRQNDEIVPAGFKKKDQARKLDASNASDIVYKKPSVNQESANSIWNQPEYLVDQKSRPTAKITQMQAPPIEARSRAMSQEQKKPSVRYSTASSISAIGNEGTDSREPVFLAHPKAQQTSKVQRPGSADPRTRYGLPGGHEEPVARDRLPIAPSSESPHGKRQPPPVRTYSQHDPHEFNRNDGRPPNGSAAFTVDAHSIVMSDSVSLRGEQRHLNQQPQSQMIFIPAGHQQGSSGVLKPPVARKAGQQIISGVNNYTNVLSGNKVSGPPIPSAKRSISGSASKPRKGSDSRRDDKQDNGIAEWPGAMNLSKQPRSASKPNSTTSKVKPSPARGNSAGVSRHHEDIVQRPAKNYKQVQSRIKDLVQKDRAKWTAQDNKFSDILEPQVRALDQVEFLTQEECTFRPEDEMYSRADHSAKQLADRSNHRRSRPESESRDTLAVSRDESSFASTKNLLKLDIATGEKLASGRRKEVTNSEHEPLWVGSSKTQNRQRDSQRHPSPDQQDLTGSSVVGIASKLLNSDIMKRLESRTDMLGPSGTRHMLQAVENNAWRHPVEKVAFRGSQLSDEPDFDDSQDKGFRGRNHYDQESKPHAHEPDHFRHQESHHRREVDQRSKSRKEEFDQDDYDMNFQNTSRASSSQFSAFCPGEDVKSFFKQEFPAESPALTQGSTVGSKGKQFFPRPQGPEIADDHSYSSSKLTYGQLHSMGDKQISQRSYLDGR